MLKQNGPELEALDAALAMTVEWLHGGPQLAALVAAMFAVTSLAAATGAVLKVSD